jgi:hypothetical protein
VSTAENAHADLEKRGNKFIPKRQSTRASEASELSHFSSFSFLHPLSIHTLLFPSMQSHRWYRAATRQSLEPLGLVACIGPLCTLLGLVFDLQKQYRLLGNQVLCDPVDASLAHLPATTLPPVPFPKIPRYNHLLLVYVSNLE